MNLSRTLLAAALSASFAFAAFAQTPTPTPTPPTDPIAEVPKNHGQAVRETAQSDQLRDATGKPIAPPGETVRETAQLQGDFMQFDGDKSGALSRTELNADADLLANFDALDSDGNGEISRIEFNSSIDMGDEEEVEDEE